MSAVHDRLAQSQTLDRVFYATGVMLDAEDFKTEQDYHRGCLARALACMNGTGTVAGLAVEHALSGEGASTRELLLVQPGVALDRLGRVIELPRASCIRLDLWYQRQAQSQDQAVVDGLIAACKGPPYNGVVADLFMRFAACERGKTPAFASGPFDALDAVQPSRLRDSYMLELVLRPENTADLPILTPLNTWGDLSDVTLAQDPNVNLSQPTRNTWADLVAVDDEGARRNELHRRILSAWPREGETSPRPREYAASQQDTTSVFLARVVIKATPAANPNAAPVRPAALTADSVVVNNYLRSFIYTPQALARALGL
jgi:hypothetical protein